MTTTTAPRIYVGTYAKYNNGDLSGKWMDLTDYDTAAEFYVACRELHSDENDPELMFQDWEGIPHGMISESYLPDDLLWEMVVENENRELVAAFLECFAVSDLPYLNDWAVGQADSFSDWCEDEAAAMFPELDDPNNRLASYFDWAKWERE